jgi:hypothetical protein
MKLQLLPTRVLAGNRGCSLLGPEPDGRERRTRKERRTLRLRNFVNFIGGAAFTCVSAR